MSSSIRKRHAKRGLDDRIRQFACSLGQPRDFFWRLIETVRGSSNLLVSPPRRGRSDPQNAKGILRACVRMANRHWRWKRPPEAWNAPDGGPFVQFRSLVSHLFDEYPVPNFMAPIWMSQHHLPWEMNLYLHLAAGRSIRQFRLPMGFRLTKRGAAFFMQAPDDLCPIGAVRWAHVRSLGGDSHLARLIQSRSFLAAPTEHEAFWESVIRFLVKNAPISDDEIIAILDFIHQQRFQPAETAWGPGAGRQPLQPEFTVKGRSLRSLRCHMVNWREEVAANLPALVPSMPGWAQTNIEPFRHVNGDVLWTIDELLTDKELRVEGSIMQHCVATYIHACSRRRTSIWSLRMTQGDHRKRLLTIEVIPRTKTIVQARGRRNSPPGDDAEMILHRWADREGLCFSE